MQDNKKPTVLAIDDDKSLLHTFEMFFPQYDINIVGAHGGQDGITKAAEIHPTAILLDILMPDMNGKVVLQHLKADPDLKDIPVLVFSNVMEEHEKQEVLQLGATDYFVKTEIEPEQLLEHIQRITKH